MLLKYLFRVICVSISNQMMSRTRYPKKSQNSVTITGEGDECLTPRKFKYQNGPGDDYLGKRGERKERKKIQILKWSW